MMTTSDTFTDAYGLHYIAGCLVPPEVWDRHWEAESLNRKHDTETTSIHADMLALAALVGVPYDGVSSPAGFLHGDIMPKVAQLTEERDRLESMFRDVSNRLLQVNFEADRAEAALLAWWRDPDNPPVEAARIVAALTDSPGESE